jgi:hypothetical protein
MLGVIQPLSFIIFLLVTNGKALWNILKSIDEKELKIMFTLLSTKISSQNSKLKLRVK